MLSTFGLSGHSEETCGIVGHLYWGGFGIKTLPSRVRFAVSAWLSCHQLSFLARWAFRSRFLRAKGTPRVSTSVLGQFRNCTYADSTPAVAEYNNRLYLFYRPNLPGIQWIRYRSMGSDGQWSTEADSGLATLFAPDIAATVSENADGPTGGLM